MSNYNSCKNCGNQLFADDISIHRKLIFRNADEFLCIKCLSEYFGCEQSAVLELIRHYRESGICTLFR